jgi:prevent-host-death family protein
VADSVNVHDAKTHFSKLLARVIRGEEIVIAKAGLPVARLVPERAARPARRVPGIDRGKLKIAEDFDVMSESELEDWYGPSLASE